MTMYMLKTPYYVENTMNMPGEMFEIKKLKNPVTLSGIKFKYKEINTGGLFTKKTIKDNFTRGTYKSNFPKRLLYIISLLTVYELSKYITELIITDIQANRAIKRLGHAIDYEEE